MAKTPGTTPVTMRLTNSRLGELDKLARVNQRSRRELVELLILQAYRLLQDNPKQRVNP